MKLFKFPYLVQQEILHNFEYKNLFLISFVSKNMKKLIRSSQIERFKSTNSIVYDSNEQLVCIPFKNTLDRILQVSDRFNHYVYFKNSYFPLDVAGKIIYFRICDISRCLVAFCHPWETAIQSIHNYFLDLFGSSVEYRWRTWNQPEFFIPQLQNLSALSISCGVKLVNLKKVQDYLSSSSPVFKRVDLRTRYLTFQNHYGLFYSLIYGDQHTTEELFPPESNLYQAESIGVTQRELATPAVLRHFQGRQAFIKCDMCKDQDLIEFVNRWKSGEAFQKLEYLTIGVCFNEISQNQILNAIGAKYIDAAKRPPRHTLPKVHIKFHGANPNTPKILSHAYVVRESDNRVASVLIQGRIFKFGVWNKTEQEFLKMV
ncbi:Protein CBG22205 [Caenorhabditis briggsae]|uniref:Protein CBG22205 n=1 Tax=Caenorhabditis briggsae TaxID=6238 RepID=A8Y1S6_CAEBR|nr:Protein CBG22205 [Caenorhabditis briggsae]CAP38846.2 Protein CBG22205 [Caenorhabditis briggsae]